MLSKKIKIISGKKGAIWVSMLIYVLIATAAVTLILQVVVPLIGELGERASFSKVQDSMSVINTYIREVASGAVGSQRQVPINLQTGILKSESGKLVWQHSSPHKLVEPYIRSQFGNFVICANCDVNAHTIEDSHIITNSFNSFVFKKIGDNKISAPFNGTDIIQNITNLITNDTIEGGFSFNILDESDTNFREGYTELLQTGTNLGSTTLILYVTNSTFSDTCIAYDLHFTVFGNSDMLRFNYENFRNC